MGMACDAEAASGGGGGGGNVPPAGHAGGVAKAEKEQAGGFLNPEETAMILTSLSRCQFGDPRGAPPPTGTVKEEAVSAADKRPGSSSGESDGERHSDLEGFSDDEDAAQRAEPTTPGGSGNNAANSRVHRVQQINFDGPVGSKLDFTDEAGFSHRFRNESNRVKSMVTKHISIDELRAHFDRPIIDVAKDFGICITLMKKICRRNGIKRWPHRQIRSLSKSIASMEAAMLSAHGGERDKYRDQIYNLKLKRESVIADPNKDNGSMFGGLSPVAAPAGVRPKASMPVQQQLQPPPHPHVVVSSSSSSTSLRPHHHHHVSAPKLSPRPTGRAETPTSSSTTPTGSHAKGGRWTSEEHAAFLEGIRLYGKDWRRVAQVVVTRSAVQTRTHAQKYLLKFAGRFPFETPEGVLPGSSATTGTHVRRHHARSPPERPARQPDDAGRASPTATVMTTPASDDSSSIASWNSDESQQQPPPQPQQQVAPLPAIKPARSEAMALILNGSPALGPEREPEALPPRSFPPLASSRGAAASPFMR